MTAWREVKLGDVCTILNGRAYKQEELLDDGKYPVLRVGNFFSRDKWYYSNLELGENKYCNNGDLLFAWSASFGPKIWDGGKVIYHYHIWKMIPNSQILDKYYLFCWLQKSVAQLTQGTHGSVMAHLTKSDMENMRLTIPPLEVQKKIAGVLSALDDKIELNNKINNNLEQQAQALFKSWFVDFEPFGSTIPDDWKIYKLGEFLPVITGKKNANVSSSVGKYPFFSCSQDIAWTNDYSFEGNAILVAGNGDFNIKFYNGKFEAYQRTYVLIPYNQHYTDWLYYAVKHNLSKITSAARGSVISFITKGNLENFEFAAPSKLENFNVIDIFSVINKEILRNKKENAELAQLRDTLLPKLMSGEIDVSQVDISDLTSTDKLSFSKD